MLERRTIHIPTSLADAGVPSTRPARLMAVREPVSRSRCSATASAIGAFLTWRLEVRPFTERADRAAGDVRGPGRDRHRERPPVRGAGAAQPAELQPRRWSSRRPRPRSCGSSPRSPTDLQPVLDAIVETRVHALRGRVRRHLSRRRRWTARASHGRRGHSDPSLASDPGRRSWCRCDRARSPGASSLERRTIHVPDVARADREYADAPMPSDAAATGPMLGVAAAARGRADRRRSSSAGRRSRRSPSADRAAGDVRRPGRHRDRERPAVPGAGAGTRVERAWTARSARSARRSRSSLDLQEVLTTIVAHAVRLSGADAGTIYELDEQTGDVRRRAPRTGCRTSCCASIAAGPRCASATATSSVGRRCAAQAVQVPDLAAEVTTSRRVAAAGAVAPGRLPRAAGRAADARAAGRRRAGDPPQDAGRVPARPSSTCSRRSPASPSWRSRTPACSSRSRRPAASWRWPASTSRSSWRTCATSCGRR